MRHDSWTPAEDAVLRRLAGTVERCALPDLLALAGYPGRSVGAVTKRAWRLDLSLLLDGHWSQWRLSRALGVGVLTIRLWAATGLLLAFGRERGSGSRGEWRIAERDVLSFIERYPYAYDWRRIRQPRWRALAEVVQQRDPWLTLTEAATVCGMSRHTVARWARQGQLRSERRHAIGGDRLVIQASSLDGLARVRRAA